MAASDEKGTYPEDRSGLAFLGQCTTVMQRLLRSAGWNEAIELVIERRMFPDENRPGKLRYEKHVTARLRKSDSSLPEKTVRVLVPEGESWLDRIDQALKFVTDSENANP